MTGKVTELERYSDIIGAVYDASLHPNSWAGALERMCAALDAKAASVNVLNPMLGKVAMFHEYGTDPVYTALLLSTYAGMSPVGAAVLVADLDQPVSAFDFIDEQEFVESRFYKEWCQPQGYHDMLGSLIAKRHDEIGSVSATRSVDRGNFGPSERQYLGLISPHVRRAVTISGLLEHHNLERETFATLMDGLSAAVFLIDRTGRSIHTNAAAEVMRAAGEPITIRDGLIAPADPQVAKAISEAIATAAAVPQLIAINGPDGQVYIAGVVNVEPQSGRFAVIVNRQGPELPAVGRAIADAYQLTPRELSVLMPLLEGRTIEVTADALGIGLSTAKTHLNRIFRKTDTSRQAELVQKILRLLPPVRS